MFSILCWVLIYYCYLYLNLILQVSKHSVQIKRGGNETVALTFTVPIPCGFVSNPVQSNAIDKFSCPMSIEMLVPNGPTGACESTLTAESKCGVKITDPDTWNKPHILNILHKDTGNYKLTSAESERKVYLKIIHFEIGETWTGVELPVINVILKLSTTFQFLQTKSSFIK